MEEQADVTSNSAMDTSNPIIIKEEPTDSQLNTHPQPVIEPISPVIKFPNSNINQKSVSKINNICLVNYDDTSDEYVSSDENESHVQIPSELNYRQTSLSESDTSTISDSDDSDSDCKSLKVERPVTEIPRVKGELTIDDLPPIEDLTISVRREETQILGKIQSIVDQLVVVQSFPGTTAVDIDSVLFLEEGKKALGKVFDVIGPVREPLYCVRFNSNNHIKEKQICVGANVYYAPKTVHTSFVFLPDLLRVKGSDASWENDIEPPAKYLDYSDDEEERSARKGKKKQTEEGAPSTEQNKPQQKPANQKNITNRERKRAMYKKNYSFPMQANPSGFPGYCPPNQELFAPQFYNQANIPFYNNMMPPHMHQQFPNTGQSSQQLFTPVFNQGVPINFNNGPSYSTNPWNGSTAPSTQNIDTTRPPPPLPPQPNQNWGGSHSHPPPPGTF